MSKEWKEDEYFKNFRVIERFSISISSSVELVEFNSHTPECPYPRKAILKRITTSEEYDLTALLFQHSGFFVRPISRFSHNSLEEYMVLEYCSNGDLNNRLLSLGKASSSHSMQYILFQFRNLAMAITIMHNLLIVHRDIKPGNIFITNKNTLKLGDFDVSKRIDIRGSSINTFKGTVRFMPKYLKQMDIDGVPAKGPMHAMNIDRYGFSCCLWLSFCPKYYDETEWGNFFNRKEEERREIIIDTLNISEDKARFLSSAMLNEENFNIEFNYISEFLEAWLIESIQEPNKFICYLCDESVINSDHIALSVQCQGHLIHVECYAEFLILWPNRYTCPLCNAELNPELIEVFKSRYCN